MISPAEFDGLIVVSTSLGHRGGFGLLQQHAEKLQAIPMISIGPSIIGEENLVFDNQSGMVSIMNHLIEAHDYRDFAYVSGPLSNSEARIRLQSYHDALEMAGIPHGEETVYLGDFSSSSGLRAVTAFFDERKLAPQVIVCANDLMAIGVWASLKKRGLSVPYDVAVTGYDDTLVKHVLSPHFTTVRQSFDKLSYLAVKRLHERVLGKPVSPLKPFPADLCVRNSCGCFELNNRTSPDNHNETTEIKGVLEKRISESINNWSPESNYKNIFHVWSNTILSLLEKDYSVHELEDMLRSGDLMNSFPAGTIHQDVVLASLYAIFLEDCVRVACVDHCLDRVLTISLRYLIDKIQEEISTDYMLSTHASRFRELCGFFEAKEMHLMQFDDPENVLAGATSLYSFVDGTDIPRWKAGPGAWFPPKGHSLVINMISSGLKRYGYYILSADIEPEDTYEYLRIRFSAMIKDLLAIRKVHELNTELVQEIAAREESERKLKDAISLVEQMSIQDELTGLYNRRGFHALAEQQLKYLRRLKSGYFIIYADLDGLKIINDTWGHDDGDLAIVSAADVLRKALRESDIVARMGGDEFTALVNQADPPNFETIKQRILDVCAVKSAALNKPWALAISIGHYYAKPGCEMDLIEMLKVADSEMYKEKQRKKAQPKK